MRGKEKANKNRKGNARRKQGKKEGGGIAHNLVLELSGWAQRQPSQCHLCDTSLNNSHSTMNGYARHTFFLKKVHIYYSPRVT